MLLMDEADEETWEDQDDVPHIYCFRSNWRRYSCELGAMDQGVQSEAANGLVRLENEP
jgi:hypothetical protein